MTNSELNFVEDIFKRKLQLYKVSPLYNLNLQNLKLYERKIRQELGFACCINFSKEVEVDGEVFHVLQVEAMSSQNTLVYRGTFFNISKENASPPGCLSLPILLVEGRHDKVSAIHSCLCKMFDCGIHCATIPFMGLVVLFVKILEQPDGDINIPEETVALDYQFPGGSDSDKISPRFNLKDTILVLAATIDYIRESVPGIDNINIMKEFYRRILNHMYNIYRFDFGMLELCKVVFPNATFAHNGEVKLMTKKALKIGVTVLEQFSI